MTNVIAIRSDDVGSRVLVPYHEMSEDQKALLKQACSSANLNDSQFALLVEVARRSGLDPFRRHLYGLFFAGKFTLVTGIDGFRAVARRNGLCGVDEVVYTYDEKDKDQKFPKTATATVYRRGEDGRERYAVTVWWREFARYTKDGKLQENWLTKGHVMLGKCAKAQAFREGFTESLGGIYERAEFGEADGDVAAKATAGPTRLKDILTGGPKATRPIGAAPIDAEWHEAGDGEPPDGEGFIPDEETT